MPLVDHLEFADLKAVVAIADARSFSKAASVLNTVQSALSHRIIVLEDALRIQIFNRGRSGARLTPVGKSFYGMADDLLRQRDELVALTQAIHEGELRPFRLGFTSFVDSGIIDTVCEMYRSMFPTGEILPEPGETEEMHTRLHAREIDAALVTLPLVPNGYAVQPIVNEPLVVCMRRDDPQAGSDELPPEVLDRKLAIFSDPRHHPRAHAKLLEMLNELGIHPQIANPTFSSRHVQSMVRERRCYALIRASDEVQPDLMTRPIRGAHWTIDSALIYPKGKQQATLPLLLRSIQKRFASPKAELQRTGSERVSHEPAQGRLWTAQS